LFNECFLFTEPLAVDTVICSVFLNLLQTAVNLLQHFCIALGNCNTIEFFREVLYNSGICHSCIRLAVPQLQERFRCALEPLDTLIVFTQEFCQDYVSCGPFLNSYYFVLEVFQGSDS